MKSHHIFLQIIFVFFLLACVSSNAGSNPGNSPIPASKPETKRGWLCDYDRTGSIRLWSAASMDATVIDSVGTCEACCVDVTMHEEKDAEGILFYRISVGSQSGWVDVEYFYWSKPAWSSN